MSRADRTKIAADSKDGARAIAPASAAADSAQVAVQIGMAALNLAERARDAGLTQLCHLLECAALEAGTKAAARWPTVR